MVQNVLDGQHESYLELGEEHLHVSDRVPAHVQLEF